MTGIFLGRNEAEPRRRSGYRVSAVSDRLRNEGRVMTTKKTAKSAAKSTAGRGARTAVSVSKSNSTGKTKALPKKVASKKASRTTLTKSSGHAVRNGTAPGARNGRVTTAQPAAHVSGRRLRLPNLLLVPVKLPRLDEIKELEKVVSRATSLTVGEGSSRIQIGGETLLAIQQVIRALSSTRGSVLFGDQTDIELTSQEVADMLNVSRPYVIKLAREGGLPHRMVGNRHRFLLSGVQQYESLRRVERDEALAAIVPDAGYAAEDF